MFLGKEKLSKLKAGINSIRSVFYRVIKMGRNSSLLKLKRNRNFKRNHNIITINKFRFPEMKGWSFIPKPPGKVCDAKKKVEFVIQVAS